MCLHGRLSAITHRSCRDTARSSSHILVVRRRSDAHRSNVRCFLCLTDCRNEPVVPVACHHRLPAHETAVLRKTNDGDIYQQNRFAFGSTADFPIDEAN